MIENNAHLNCLPKQDSPNHNSNKPNSNQPLITLFNLKKTGTFKHFVSKSIFFKQDSPNHNSNQPLITLFNLTKSIVLTLSVKKYIFKSSILKHFVISNGKRFKFRTMASN